MGCREALAALEALAPFDFDYVEQPLAADDFDGFAALHRNAPLRLAADESVATEAGALRLIDAAAVDAVVLKPATLGGAALGFLAVDLGAVTNLFTLPLLGEGEFGNKFILGRAGDVLPPPGGTPLNFPKGKFWLARTHDNKLVAPYKVCPHLGSLYNWNEEGDQFLCPCHYSQYKLDGTVIRGPAPRSTDRFVIRLLDETGEEVAATDDEGNPLPLPNEDLQVVVETGMLIAGKAKGIDYPVG